MAANLKTSPVAAKTVPMKIDAEAALRMTLNSFKLNAEDRVELEKAMRMYGDLRVAEAAESGA